MKKIKILTSIVAIGVLFSACVQQPTYVDGTAAQVKKGDSLSMSLTGEDFDNTAKEMLNSLFSSGYVVNKIGNSGRAVVAVYDVVNDTALRIDTRNLTDLMVEELINSGKFIASATQGNDSATQDNMDDLMSDRYDDRYDRATVSKDKTQASASLTLQGRIGQQNVKLSNGKTQVEYFFVMKLAEKSSGLVVWQKTNRINKLGSSKTVSW
ncbi:penicillin-binding protein activator LpoB [Campylobacter lari]|uniref:Penicillin-binding protein activator LpoB n=1 Tax=Campylobacter lari TaxID=201 RepID=A0A825SGT1_CAMLA|nr:penicillin-binding protein activator LpoB [Campylobacter lari]EAK0451236.1 penicillin-binding protein activator LpoB [Campylobacter lari]ECP5263081.1 penicillin-binding protein activator LpoB [Campylobacter lari]EIE4558326.1 penicillin-binding protein activator LpoB [Campylobacter lari]EIE4559830.1 penicillin-binding protein activator LpoB [Campylobacter lari]